MKTPHSIIQPSGQGGATSQGEGSAQASHILQGGWLRVSRQGLFTDVPAGSGSQQAEAAEGGGVGEHDSLQPPLLTCKGGMPGADPKGRNGVLLPGSAVDWWPSGVRLTPIVMDTVSLVFIGIS